MDKPPPHPDFDGHLEKPLSQMTPREKIDYLWLQMQFRWSIRNRKITRGSQPKPQEPGDKPL